MILQGGQHAWLIPFFPGGIEVASLASFPESPKFVARAMRMIDSRSENAYVIFEASKDTRLAQIAKINRILANVGVGKSGFVCDVVRWGITRNSRLNAQMSDTSNGVHCGIAMDPGARRDLAEENKAIARASNEFAKTRYGLRIDLPSCVTYPSWVGKRFRVVEIPVEYVDRPAGSFSKLNTLADGAKVIFAIFQILRYYKPLAFFGTVSALFMVLGLIAGIPVLAEWFMYRYIDHVPLAVLAAALEIVAVIFFSVALMLDSIVHQHRMSYELMIVSTTKKS